MADETSITRRTRARPEAGFIERSVAGFISATERSLFAEQIARQRGLLQRIDPRVKLAGLLLLVIASAVSHRLAVLIALLVAGLLLGVLSRVPMRVIATRIWLGVFVFTGAIALPACVTTPGRAIAHLPLVGWPVTYQGLVSAGYLVARVETAATFSALLVLCTPWADVLKALRVLRVPVVIVVILGMSYRYLFLLLETARDMLESRRSRIVGKMSGAQSRRTAAASVGVLLGKSLHLSNEVYLAMQSRGFRGEVRTMNEFTFKTSDAIALACFVGAFGLSAWLGNR